MVNATVKSGIAINTLDVWSTLKIGIAINTLRMVNAENCYSDKHTTYGQR